MARIALDAQHFGNHLKFLSGFSLDLEADGAANVGQTPRQMYECSCRSDVLGRSFGNHVGALNIIPLCAHLQTHQVARASAIVTLGLAKHGSSSGKASAMIHL